MDQQTEDRQPTARHAVTFRELMERVIGSAENDVLRLETVSLGVGEADRLGAAIALHIIETYPKATQGLIEDALQSALWWLTFNGATRWAKEKLGEK